MFTGELDEILKRLNAEWTQFKVLTLTDTAVQLPPLSVTVVELEPICDLLSGYSGTRSFFQHYLQIMLLCSVVALLRQARI